MIKTIIFDVGNVLFGYDPQYILHQLLPDNGYHDVYIRYLFKGKIWQDLDRGIVTEFDVEQVLTGQINDPELAQNFRHILNNFVYHLSLIKGSRAIFLALRQQYDMYLCSNFQSVPFSKLRELHPFLTQVDGQVISAHQRLMKPEPDIYEWLFNTYSIDPASALFIDDLPENVAAAQSLNCNGIVFKSPDQLTDALTGYGINLSLIS